MNIKNTKIKIDMDAELKKAINYERNRQLKSISLKSITIRLKKI